MAEQLAHGLDSKLPFTTACAFRCSAQWLVSVVVASGLGWVTLLVWAYRADVPGTLGPNYFVVTARDEVILIQKSFLRGRSPSHVQSHFAASCRASGRSWVCQFFEKS